MPRSGSDRLAGTRLAALKVGYRPPRAPPPSDVNSPTHCFGQKVKAQLMAESSSWFAARFFVHDSRHSAFRPWPDWRHARSHSPSSTHAGEPRQAFVCFAHFCSAQAKQRRCRRHPAQAFRRRGSPFRNRWFRSRSRWSRFPHLPSSPASSVPVPASSVPVPASFVGPRRSRVHLEPGIVVGPDSGVLGSEPGVLGTKPGVVLGPDPGIERLGPQGGVGSSTAGATSMLESRSALPPQATRITAARAGARESTVRNGYRLGIGTLPFGDTPTNDATLATYRLDQRIDLRCAENARGRYPQTLISPTSPTSPTCLHTSLSSALRHLRRQVRPREPGGARNNVRLAALGVFRRHSRTQCSRKTGRGLRQTTWTG